MDCRVVLYNLPTSIKGYTVKNIDDTYTILLNSRLTYEQNVKSYKHELKHINNNDFDKDNVDLIEIDAHA